MLNVLKFLMSQFRKFFRNSPYANSWKFWLRVDFLVRTAVMKLEWGSVSCFFQPNSESWNSWLSFTMKRTIKHFSRCSNDYNTVIITLRVTSRRGAQLLLLRRLLSLTRLLNVSLVHSYMKRGYHVSRSRDRIKDRFIH